MNEKKPTKKETECLNRPKKAIEIMLTLTPEEIRMRILFELSGYFRRKDQSDEEGIAEGMKKMLLIGTIWGLKNNLPEQEEVTRLAMNVLNLYDRYQDAIISELKEIKKYATL